MLMSLRGGSEKKLKKFFVAASRILIGRNRKRTGAYFTIKDISMMASHVLARGWCINALARMRQDPRL